MGNTHFNPSIETHGWTLISAEERHAASPDAFEIPPRDARETLSAGSGVKLLFDIEVRGGSRVLDRGVERMWVLVKGRTAGGTYVGILDSEPVLRAPTLLSGDTVHFGPEHIAGIDSPPRDYIVAKYGVSFFDGESRSV